MFNLTKKLPTNAIIAVTLNCNSHCIMCDIWQNQIKKELSSSDYLKLPHSLTDINITGGEPFLRTDLPLIIKNIKKVCPRARLIINTNGFLPQIINKQISTIKKIDPRIAIRVSIDGFKTTHNQIRNFKNGYQKALESIQILQKNKIKDLGISFTIMDQNYQELPKMYHFCNKNNLELSLTIASDSPIYFGKNKTNLRPQSVKNLKTKIDKIIKSQYLKNNIKENFRAWFTQKLFDYYQSNIRPYACDAGQNFFYLDSIGNVYGCHLKNHILGNLTKNSFKKIWKSTKANKFRKTSHSCQDCWMICSSKTNIKNNLIPISFEIIKEKIKLWLK